MARKRFSKAGRGVPTLVLRDGAVVEGGVYLNEGQALAAYLGSRKGGWVNVINAMWLATSESSNHAVMQADHIRVASSIDGDIPVFGVTAEALAIIPEKLARKLGVLPQRVHGRTLVIAVSDPRSMEIEQQIGFITRQRLVMEIVPPADIRGGLDWHYGASGGAK